MLFVVLKVKAQNGESANLSWVAPFFPSAQGYTIFHTINTTQGILLKIDGTYRQGQSTKYEYLTEPYNSTNITFEIKNVTLKDAGYYNGGTQKDDAMSCGGVVLIVYGESIQTINNTKDT